MGKLKSENKKKIRKKEEKDFPGPCQPKKPSRSPLEQPSSGPRGNPVPQPNPAHVPLRGDKTGDEVFVFVLATVNTREGASTTASSTSAIAAVVDRQRTAEKL
jgi:hypothetical protein